MTINAPAALLLLLYELAAEEQGVPADKLRGTVQNDILKEYIARGNYIFPPRPSMRITTDLFTYCAERLPLFNTISVSGYHIREAGSTAVQELAFTVANGIAYCEAAVAAGLSPDEFGERVSFFFNAHNDFLQEVAKFRAARRLWARVMRERFGATNPRALALRFHAQTGGSTLTAQQPELNIVRVAVQALAAVCGGAQSLHTNSFDEALALPTERAARIALRTQQVLQHEVGTTPTADPLGGSYAVEALTRELEARAWELIERIDELGGAVAAVEQGFVQHEIEEAAFRFARDVERGERVVVGVNRYVDEGGGDVELQRIDPEVERRQLERTARVRAERDPEAAARALGELRSVAESTGNLLVSMREALRANCTIGEICGELRDVFGTYDAQRPAS
jgi:methylmalonyl-CoA mutase N-terminal domain/subunit